MTAQELLAGTRTTSLDPQAFHAAAAAFETARVAHPEVVRERHYRIAGRLVRVRIVGPRLAAALQQPWTHLGDASHDDEEVPALAIDVWHEAETGVPRPGPAVDPELGLYGYMSVSEDLRFIAEQRPHSVHWLDRRANRALVWISALDRLCLDERARPFHRLLALRLLDFGVQLIHAGLVAWDDGGILFTGKGGSGKSTCSICCALAGASYLGDDFIGLEAEPDDSFSGHSLYGTALISSAHMTLYPALAPVSAAGNYPEEEKSVVGIGSLASVRLGTTATIRAIVLPRVAARANETIFRRVSAREALLALAPSSVLYLPGAGPRTMERLGALVERVPAYRLEMGRDMTQIPARVKEVLADARHRADH